MTQTTPPGWYHGEGDPAGTLRWWDGSQWMGEPQANMGNTGSNLPSDGNALPAGNSASVLRRIFGRIIDAIIVFIPTAIVFGASLDFDGISDAFETLGDAAPGDSAAQTEFQDTLAALIEDGLEGAGTVMAAVLLGIWVVEILMYKMIGATPGKLITSTRLASAAGGADSPVSWLQAAIRPSIRLLSVIGYLVAVASGLLGLVAIAIGIVSLIMLFAVDRNQTLMDKIARTVVINRPAKS